jgi:DNA-binding transcriptional MerR regulator
MFKIGDFSRFSRVSVKMLRHYDQLGLLKPAHVDPFTNYRYYSVDQLPRLNRLIALKDLGFTLEQIARLLNDDLSAEQIKGMLKLKRAEIEQQVQAEERKLARVEARLKYIELEDRFPAYEVIVRQIEPQLVASIRRTVQAGENSAEEMFEQIEAHVARFKARADTPPLIIYHDAEYHERNIDIEVAVPINRRLPENKQVVIYELSYVENMACTIHTGSYTTINHAYHILFSWLETNNYRLAGPPRELYLRFGADNVGYELPPAYLATEPAAYVTELQLPFEKA